MSTIKFEVKLPKQSGGTKRFYKKKDRSEGFLPEKLNTFYKSIVDMGYQEVYFDHSQDTSVFIGADPQGYIVVGKLPYGQKSFEVTILENGKINALMSILDKEHATFLSGPLEPSEEGEQALQMVRDSFIPKGFTIYHTNVIMKPLGLHLVSMYKIQEEAAGIKHVIFRDVMVNIKEEELLVSKEANYPLFLGEEIVAWCEKVSQAQKEKTNKEEK